MTPTRPGRCPGPSRLPLPLPPPTDPAIVQAVARVRAKIRTEMARLDMGGAMVFTAAVAQMAREEAGYAADDAAKPT